MKTHPETIDSNAELTRGQRLWEELRPLRDTATISLERARWLTASDKETVGLPIPIRRAKAFEKIVTHIPIYIDGGQLLVGDWAARPMTAEWHPERTVFFVEQELEAGRPPCGLEEKDVVELKEICGYWRGRNIRDSYLAYLGEEERQRLTEISEEGAFIYQYFREVEMDRGWFCPDYEKAIRQGFLGILGEVEQELEATVILDDASCEKTLLLKGIAIELKAAIEYAKRYVALARELARTAEGKRRSELEKIAEICEWVPANPARNFYEALQTMWFVHLLGYLDCGSNGWSPGRMDQYLYPYYKRDVDEGKLSREEAIELLECFRIKISGYREFRAVYTHETWYGERQFHNITLGGQTPGESDATNELSYLFLEAAFRVRTPHPTLSVRWHENLSQDFAMRAVELCRLGLGYPAWFGDKATLPYLTGKRMGATLEEARDYQLSGCVIHTIPHKTAPPWPLILNMGKVFELALNNGRDPSTGKQWGPKTGRFEDMRTWDELYSAYKEQVGTFIKESAAGLNRMRGYRARMLPQIWASAFFDDCIKRGQDVVGGGCRYQGSSMFLLPIGIMDVTDSLAAVKKCVFEDGRVSKQQLMEALATNFEGYGDIRQVLLSAPKYGNDDDYVDSIAVDIYKFLVEVCDETDAAYGGKYVCSPHSVFIHGTAGRRCEALPSGRLARVPLADGATSPCQGADVHGPTAVIRSAGKIDQTPIFGTLLNMKFSPSVLQTRDDLLKLIALIKTYLDDYGGKHIQFNVISRETLLDAQLHPELHHNLVVRVAGYSALWVDLDRTIQNEIIARMEHGW